MGWEGEVSANNLGANAYTKYSSPSQSTFSKKEVYHIMFLSVGGFLVLKDFGG